MVSRAWWLSTVLGVVILGSSFAVAAPPKYGASRDAIDAYMGAQAKSLADVDSDAAVRIRQDVESGVDERQQGGPLPAGFGSDYVSSAASAFRPLIAGGKEQTRLAAVILLVNLSRANEATEPALTDALQSDLPAIRYWAAKGFAYVIPKYELVPTLRDNAINKVRTAIASEKSTLVKAELYRTLTAVGDKSSATGAIVVKDLLPLVDGFKAKMPTPTDLKTVAQGFDTLRAFASQGGTLSSEDRVAALQLTADAASFPIQHLLAAEAKDASQITPDSLSAAYGIAVSGYKLANVLAPSASLNFHGKQPNGKPEWLKEFSLSVTQFFGSSRAPGQLQSAVPEVKAPADIK